MCNMANGYSGFILDTIIILTFISINLTTTVAMQVVIVMQKEETDIIIKIATNIQHIAVATIARAVERYIAVTEDPILV